MYLEKSMLVKVHENSYSMKKLLIIQLSKSSFAKVWEKGPVNGEWHSLQKYVAKIVLQWNT